MLVALLAKSRSMRKQLGKHASMRGLMWMLQNPQIQESLRTAFPSLPTLQTHQAGSVEHRTREKAFELWYASNNICVHFWVLIILELAYYTFETSHLVEPSLLKSDLCEACTSVEASILTMLASLAGS
jgi:hypothetical protein